MKKNYPNLNPKKALIWRIVHRNNLPWILEHGLHPGSSDVKAEHWVNIGNEELIDRRSRREVPIAPGGMLDDYVPFYFTPFSPMLYNIYTGRGGVKQRSNDEIVILVSNLYRVQKLGLGFVFTDRHAYPATTEYFSDLGSLDEVDWQLLQRRDFQRDPDDPLKMERYQAEALIHQHMPVEALQGVVCYTEELQHRFQQLVEEQGLELQVVQRTRWYF